MEYTENDDFKSYRVTVEYGDGITEYTKYEWDDYDNKFLVREEWSYYDNGVLASYTIHDGYDGVKTSTFAADGVSTGYSTLYSKMTFGGNLNNRTVTYYAADGWDDNTQQYTSWKKEQQEAYTYSADNGKLTEYTVNGYYHDAYKHTYSYDEFGRIVAIREYGTGDDNVHMPGGDVNGDGVIDENDRVVVTRAEDGTSDSPEWQLGYEEMYTYFNDDVYGVGNSWHDVFGMDGPLLRIDVTDYEGKSSTEFTRNADGKLTGIIFPVDESVGDGAVQGATIDDNGQILKIEDSYSYDDGDMSYSSSTITEYTWTNGQMVKAVMTDKYESNSPDDGNSSERTETTRYAYGDGKVTVTKYDEGGTAPSSTTEIEEHGTSRKMHYSVNYGTFSEDETIARYVQTEDISFVRPNLAADVEGMTADSTIVVSVAGRVVCAYEGRWNPEFGYVYQDYDNESYYANTTSGSTYFTIEHDGNETVCSDINGLPVYVLTGGRLAKEYKYYDVEQEIDQNVPAEQQAVATRSASVPEGQAYDEITYVYDVDGRLAGKTEVSVDADGTRTEEITLEYKYDETSGIASVEATAKAGVTLDGRRIGLSDGRAFSVCTMGGQVLASGVTSYTFTSPGVYIVNAGRVTAKVLVK